MPLSVDTVPADRIDIAKSTLGVEKLTSSLFTYRPLKFLISARSAYPRPSQGKP